MPSIKKFRQSDWWRQGTAYQIWPASYKDSNGDGIGDIQGIIGTLDYLKAIGIDILWISPMYQSPQHDMGYDISDYEQIDPRYGTLADAEMLIQACHRRGMKILFDLVINHTSDEHAWFRESSSSRSNPKRDWYIWRPPVYDARGNRHPPTNWRARFGDSVWTWHEETQEYYFHLYTPEMPDLNWNNDECRRNIYKSAVRFWLDRGLDGFRVDVANKWSKPTVFRDAEITDPTQTLQLADQIYCNGPRIHEFHRDIHEICAEYDAVTVGELPHTADPQRVLSYISAEKKQMHMVLLPELVYLGQGRQNRYNTTPISTSDLKKTLSYHQQFATSFDGWTTSFLENHDQARSLPRYGDVSSAEMSARSGKMLAILLCTLSGTLFLYQGQEIGMTNCPREWAPNEYPDCQSQNYLKRVRRECAQNGEPVDDAVEEAMDGIQHVSRDNGRTPVQWSNEANAGFTTGKPWVKVNPNYRQINVRDQAGDPDSLLTFWRAMINFRKVWGDVTVYGEFRVFREDLERECVYAKVGRDGMCLLVFLNFSRDKIVCQVPEGWRIGKLVAANMAVGEANWLQAWEGRVYTAQQVEED